MKTYISFLVFLLLCIINSWAQPTVGSAIFGTASSEQFGLSMDFSDNGTRLAIGAPFGSASLTDQGYIRIYEYDGIDWVLLGNPIFGTEADAQSGRSVALSADGSRVVIGGNGANLATGLVKVYEYNGTDWVQIGQTLNGVANFNNFGWSVAISDDGSRIIAGGTGSSPGGTFAGNAIIYDYNGSSWVQVGNRLNGSGLASLGWAVSISADGSRIATGASREQSNRGVVRAYELSGGTWIQVGGNMVGEFSTDQFGYSLDMTSDGNQLVIGARDNIQNGSDAGHARVFEYDGTNWVQKGSDLDGLNAGDQAGTDVAISSTGNRVSVGMPENDSLAFSGGLVQTYEYDGTNWAVLDSVLLGSASERYGRRITLSGDGEWIATAGTSTMGASTLSYVQVFRAFAPPAPGPVVPTLSEWGMIILAFLLVNIATVFILRGLQQQKQEDLS